MTEEIISALISGGVTLLICILNNNAQTKKIEAQHDTTIAVIDEKLTSLKEQVEKHNSIVERTYKLEQDMALNDERIKVANHRIDDLEKRGE